MRRQLGVESLEQRDVPATGILFFGNGYTSVNSVDQLVQKIATAAGQSSPVVGTHTVTGSTLLSQATSLTSSAISGMLPAGQLANVAVLQGSSVESASQVANHNLGPSYSDFRTGALQLAADVRAADPNARIILMETWALPGSNPTPDVYPSVYPGQNLMQVDIRNGYQAAITDLKNQYGVANVDIAPVGDAFQILGFNNNLFATTANGTPNPGGQASLRGSLLAALTTYATIYQANASSIPFSAVSSFATGLTATDWSSLASAADQAVGNAHKAQITAYVTQLYQSILGRAPDTTGLNNLVNQMVAGTLSRAGAAQALVNTVEYRKSFIKSIYETYLKREPDTAGMNNLLTQLANGASLDTIRASILSSVENYNLQGGTVTSYVNGLFQEVLQRAPTSAELGAITNQLNGGTTRLQVATSLVNSLENRRRQATNLFQSLLGRAPNSTELQNIASQLQAGAMFQGVVAAIAGSLENFNRFRV
jgi:hypothetical protein